MNKKILVLLSLIGLASCAQYKKNFGGHSDDYSKAEVTKELRYPKGMQGLQASDRYSIPQIKNNVIEVNISPPEE